MSDKILDSNPASGDSGVKAAGKIAAKSHPGTAELGSSPLYSAMQELREQHPQAHYDHGPHHGMTNHQRHQRVDFSKIKG